MPAGNELRSGWNQVDEIIAARKASPIFRAGTEGNYHPDVDHAFRSLALGHALCSLRFSQKVRSVVPDPYSSVMSGA